jgi:hypothetical protein
VKVKSGKWYYEIKLITNGLFQIGWCTTAFTPDAAVRSSPCHLTEALVALTTRFGYTQGWQRRGR